MKEDLPEHILIVPPGADLDDVLATLRRAGVTDAFAEPHPGGAAILRFTGASDQLRALRPPKEAARG